ncbi:hypothetical protein V5799_014281 [Amblyomma americanum]|uniref:Uncharacterized protein n=1 Tax=Amblyomma americanum TaxID=6943 RepID=A0AAQ4E3I6_AMBAM
MEAAVRRDSNRRRGHKQDPRSDRGSTEAAVRPDNNQRRGHKQDPRSDRGSMEAAVRPDNNQRRGHKQDPRRDRGSMEAAVRRDNNQRCGHKQDDGRGRGSTEAAVQRSTTLAGRKRLALVTTFPGRARTSPPGSRSRALRTRFGRDSRNPVSVRRHLDASGRRCAIALLRERGTVGPAAAGGRGPTAEAGPLHFPGQHHRGPPGGAPGSRDATGAGGRVLLGARRLGRQPAHARRLQLPPAAPGGERPRHRGGAGPDGSGRCLRGKGASGGDRPGAPSPGRTTRARDRASCGDAIPRSTTPEDDEIGDMVMDFDLLGDL